MKTLLIALAIISGGDWVDSMLHICGAGCIEELDNDTFEHFEHLNASPLRINSAGKAALVGSGLFSSYQAASLLEYRQRTGSILSLTELSLVNGFNEQTCTDIAPFISFESGEGIERCYAQDVGVRYMGDTPEARYSLNVGNNFVLNAATSGTWSSEYTFRGLTVTAGDFHARFGQGLNLWTSMTISGAGNAALSRNPGRISAAHSYSRSSRLRGVALNLERRSLESTVLLSSGGVFAGNANFRWSSAQLGMTAVCADGDMTVSSDFKMNVAGIDLYGECAFDIMDRKWAGLAGATWSPGYRERFSALARLYPAGYSAPRSSPLRSSGKGSDEAGITLASEYHGFCLTADASYKLSTRSSHLKTMASYRNDFRLGPLTLTPSIRITERIRPMEALKFKTGIRADMTATADGLEASFRYETIMFRDRSFLCFTEIGYKTYFNIRATLFKADNWDDRIYAWQRDISGTFSVPAFYGRGWAVSAYLKLWKCLEARISWTEYPLDRKRDSFVLRLQYVKHFFHLYPSRAFHKHD